MDDQVKIAIHDSGIGINATDMTRIFDRFYRADSARTKQSGGLGLSIVKSIMESHRGKIEIKSQLHCGTSIFLQFPC